ncbi:hypothetical protein PHYSODRAFT_313447 [Phytophthora sojae]|uniref:Uncharacterized protein n=1 Tax=Phytophthora sojae (strain P6497) TaxID=1094619 RepID=G4Z7N6_PHYSP|nr:hypothetical protein PHYSODRAFT_313447 [Phytophthora sojae]EGZ21075.1 hypothetical protein PHYSODRAFT_313447 [Phytophthora sojae]|eukprot:XP_009523792.1 hypothetical protein PHYSODRAFT_313447 [Phytophthora sojae]
MTLACVSIKIGVITKTSRTNLRSSTAPALVAYKPKTTRDDATIYLKPSLGAKQVEWVALSSANWRDYVAIARGNYHKRKNVSGIRRVTTGRIQEAARAIDSYLLERGDVRVGPIARTYWETTHARQPDGTEPALPNNATFRQMQHLDSMRSEPPPAQSDPEFRTITVRLNGSSDLQLAFNLQELRAALELPNHSLLAEGLFASFQPPKEPSEDMSDIDHMSE